MFEMDTPSNAEVLQVEPPESIMVPVPVDVKGPVQTRELPAQSSTARSYDFLATDTAPMKVLNEDPKRKSAVIVGTAAFKFGFSQPEAAANTAARWPLGIPLQIGHQDQVWVRIDAGAVT